MDDTPDVFLALRSNHGSARFHDLSLHSLTVAEKNWLLKQVCREDATTYLLKKVRKELNARYNLPKDFWGNNLESYRKNGTSSGKGKPFCINNEGIQRVAELIHERSRQTLPVTDDELLAVLNRERQVTDQFNGRVDPTFESIDWRTFQRIKSRSGIKLSTGQHITEAEIRARSCPIMSYIWYLICYSMSAYLPARRKWNSDGTTHVFEMAGKGQRVLTLLNPTEYNLDDDKISYTNKKTRDVKSKNVNSKLPFAIKVEAMINAGGSSLPLVTVVAVKEMDPNSWHVEEVSKLAISALPGAKGYIYFCRTGCGVREMWIDYFKRVVIPTIVLVNQDNHSLDTTESSTFFSTDGEDMVICSGYDDDVAESFRVNNIDYGRVGAATTGIHNPCDRAALFRDLKKTIASVLKKNIDVRDEALQASVKVSFSNLKTKFPEM